MYDLIISNLIFWPLWRTLAQRARRYDNICVCSFSLYFLNAPSVSRTLIAFSFLARLVDTCDKSTDIPSYSRITILFPAALSKNNTICITFHLFWTVFAIMCVISSGNSMLFRTQEGTLCVSCVVCVTHTPQTHTEIKTLQSADSEFLQTRSLRHNSTGLGSVLICHSATYEIIQTLGYWFISTNIETKKYRCPNNSYRGKSQNWEPWQARPVSTANSHQDTQVLFNWIVKQHLWCEYCYILLLINTHSQSSLNSVVDSPVETDYGKPRSKTDLAKEPTGDRVTWLEAMTWVSPWMTHTHTHG